MFNRFNMTVSNEFSIVNTKGSIWTLRSRRTARNSMLMWLSRKKVGLIYSRFTATVSKCILYCRHAKQTGHNGVGQELDANVVKTEEGGFDIYQRVV